MNELCRDIIRENSKSFYLASLLLPARARDHATVVYAWCRRADDAVDEGDGDKAAALAALFRELELVEAGEPTGDPIVDAFSEVVQTCGLPLMYPRQLLHGMGTDLGPVCLQTTDELLLYCYRVAATVGLMMCHVMGVDEDHAVVHAAHLGVAMQLTNICRDVVEDWGRGRLYLPADLLGRHGLADLGASLGGPFPAAARSPLAGAVRELLALADRYYQSGDAGLKRLPWRCAVAISAARRIYAEIGQVLVERACDVTAGRAFVGLPRKLRLVRASMLDQALAAPSRVVRPARFRAPTRRFAFDHMPRL